MFELKKEPPRGRMFFTQTKCGKRATVFCNTRGYAFDNDTWNVWIQDGEYIHEGKMKKDLIIEIEKSIHFPLGKDLPMNRFMGGDAPLFKEFTQAKFNR